MLNINTDEERRSDFTCGGKLVLILNFDSYICMYLFKFNYSRFIMIYIALFLQF